ncbi:MAG: hypothetical protein KDC49_20165 [Saprospiraceae bacterium]|nr:hypothetical protein [Saprospiraceae bacterium]
MNALLIKITIMPVIIALVTLISRKWGNTIGGMIASMPWVAGPIILFIALEQGSAFAAASISGVMMGIIGWLTFCLAYIYVGYRHNAIWSVLAGYAAYLLTAYLFHFLDGYLSLTAWFFLTLFLITLTVRYYPDTGRVVAKAGKPLRFDIPMRMVVMTSFVLIVTYSAQMLGPMWSGILTPVPVMTAVLAMFTHYTQGIDATIVILKGMFIGIYGFTAFLFLQAFLLPVMSVYLAFLIGLNVNVLVSLLAKALFEKFGAIPSTAKS